MALLDTLRTRLPRRPSLPPAVRKLLPQRFSLPSPWRGPLRHVPKFIGRIMPKGLYPRSLIIIIAPMVLLQSVVAFVFMAHHVVTAAIGTFLIGTIVAIGPALQIRLMDVAGEAQTLAAALNHSAFNMANALGAWLGGVAIASGLGWTSTGWVGALLGLAGLGMFAWSLSVERRTLRGVAAHA